MLPINLWQAIHYTRHPNFEDAKTAKKMGILGSMKYGKIKAKCFFAVLEI